MRIEQRTGFTPDFDIAPDSRKCYLSPQHRWVLEHPGCEAMVPRTDREIWAARSQLPDNQLQEFVLSSAVLKRGDEKEYARRICIIASKILDIDPSSRPSDYENLFQVWFFLNQPVVPLITYKQAWEMLNESWNHKYQRWDDKVKKLYKYNVKPDDSIKTRISNLFVVMAKLKGTFFASVRKVAQLIDGSVSTVGKWMKRMVESGLIGIVKRGKPSANVRLATWYKLKGLEALKHAELNYSAEYSSPVSTVGDYSPDLSLIEGMIESHSGQIESYSDDSFDNQPEVSGHLMDDIEVWDEKFAKWQEKNKVNADIPF
jgi:hypothetical protein